MACLDLEADGAAHRAGRIHVLVRHGRRHRQRAGRVGDPEELVGSVSSSSGFGSFRSPLTLKLSTVVEGAARQPHAHQQVVRRVHRPARLPVDRDDERRRARRALGGLSARGGAARARARRPARTSAKASPGDSMPRKLRTSAAVFSGRSSGGRCPAPAITSSRASGISRASRSAIALNSSERPVAGQPRVEQHQLRHELRAASRELERHEAAERVAHQRGRPVADGLVEGRGS